MYGSVRHHPFISLLYLLLLVLLGAVIFTALGFGIGVAIYGFGVIGQYQQIMIGETNEALSFIKIIQTASTIGMFIVPALVFARIESGNIPSFLQLNRRLPWILILVTIALMFCSGPFIEWTVAVNKRMTFPDSLQWLQEWMKNKEEELDRITKMLLVMDKPADLAINLLMIAVLPAIGEEFIFRGCLQNIFGRWTGNYHWGIWLSAFLFSAIHLQFYGFVPRMLLGVLFGYLLVWGRSLWLPVLAHLINNAGAVITAYIYQLKGKSLDALDDSPPQTWPVYLVSLLMTLILLGYMYSRWRRGREHDENYSGGDDYSI